VQVTIQAQTSGTLVAALDVVIIGTSDGSGGVVMQQSQATFGPPATPRQYTGRIVGLDGSRILLALANGGGSPLDLRVDVTINGARVTGELASVSAAGATARGGVGDGN
jgi:hypothetical protein